MERDRQTSTWLNGWRIAGWGALLALLALPAIGMALTDDVNWTALDFFFAAVLLGLLGTGLELAFLWGKSVPQHLAIAIFAFAAFFTLWSNLAVGIIGQENEPVNLGFTAMTIVATVIALALRFRPSAMRWICAMLALAQPALGIVALYQMPGHQVEWGILALFALLWGSAGMLFQSTTGR